MQDLSCSRTYDLQTCVLESRRVLKLPAEALLAECSENVARDRGTTVELLIRLGAIDERQLYLPLACASMYAYCTQVMRMSENVAFQRIRAARAARRFPEVLPMLADGRLHVTAVALLAPHLKRDNLAELLAEGTHKGRVEIERMIASRFPKPDVTTVVRLLPSASTPTASVAQVIANVAQSPCLGKVAPMLSIDSSATMGPLAEGVETRAMHEVLSHVVHTAARAAGAGDAGSEPLLEAIATAMTDTLVRAARPADRTGDAASEPSARVTPRAAGRYAWQLTADQPMQDMLEEARELIGPAGARELQDVLKRALTLLVESLRKSRRAASERPAAQRAGFAMRYIPRAVARAVWDRDGGQCTFTAPDGRRCCERSGLELDHVVPFGRGGQSTVENLTLLCVGHNQYEAERAYGTEYVRLEREHAKANAEIAKRGNAEARVRAAGKRGMGKDSEGAVAPTRPAPGFADMASGRVGMPPGERHGRQRTLIVP